MGIVKQIGEGTKLALWRALNRAPRIAYVGGWLGHRNLGDEALFAADRALFPGASLYPMRGYPEDVSVARMTRAFNSAVLAGGTLINKHDTGLIRAQGMLDMAEHRFVFGTGVADVAFWEGRKAGKKPWHNNLAQWRDVLERCRYVGVRGPLSRDILAGAGLKNVEIIGDPVLTFADCSRGALCREKTLGLNLGLSAGRMWEKEECVLSKVVELASFARNAGWKVIWFVVWPEDYDPTQSAAKESRTEDHVHAVYTDHAKYMELVSKVSVFIGIKLHAVALATCAGVPSIMLEYRPKCRDYMESIGQGHLCERVDLFKAQSVWERVLEMHSNRERYAGEMAERISRLQAFQRQRAREIVDQIGTACR
jgi:hypothetical protein